MRTIDRDELYELLPALYRLRDGDEGRPLQALLRVIAEQAAIVDQNIDRLWDDFFIETSQGWVIPYIGDLVSNNLLHEASVRARVDVAKTIYYRRRKGTLPMLEELARDITGWGSKAVEFFELLGWTQNLNHLRFQACQPDLRDVDALDRVDGPFDELSHTVDVGPPSTQDGWHNIPKLGFFLFRLGSYPRLVTVLEDATRNEVPVRSAARRATSGTNRYHFGSVGVRAPLFTRWRTEGDPVGLAQEVYVPGPIRPRAFAKDLDAAKAGATDLDFYGPELSLAVFRADGTLVSATDVVCKDLSAWQAPSVGSSLVAIDVATGRLAFAEGSDPGQVTVQYHYGFSGDMGGGSYERRRRGTTGAYKGWGKDTVADPGACGTLLQVSAVGIPSLAQALAVWKNTGAKAAVIQVEDDRTYPGDIEIDMTGTERLVIQAGNQQCPTILGDIIVKGAAPDAHLVLDGLIVEGRACIEDDLEVLRIAHCTLVPGRSLDEDGLPEQGDLPSIEALKPTTELTLVIYRSIVGALSLPEDMEGLEVRESIIDGVDRSAIARAGTVSEAGPATKLHSVTLFGEVHVRSLEYATDVIFTDTVRVLRTQDGCVRFSYVPPGSRTPRRYRCQPQLALGVGGLTDDEKAGIAARLAPAFTSIHYGDPGYAQLVVTGPKEIHNGAEDGSEMGAFSFLCQPQREANLRIRLEEYLPFGLEPALIYVT